VTQKHLPPRAMGLFLLAIVAWPCLSSAVQGNVPHDKSTKGESPSFLNDLIPVLTKWRIGDGWRAADRAGGPGAKSVTSQSIWSRAARGKRSAAVARQCDEENDDGPLKGSRPCNHLLGMSIEETS
jgi:hypothetical protein